MLALAACVVALADQWPAPAPSTASLVPPAPPEPVVRRERRPPVAAVGGAVAGLDPALRKALRRAAGAAARDGVAFFVNSGRRTPEHQAQLLRDAVARYGSLSEASRWVATPETSPHVSGDAVDVAPAAARAWLSAHGAAYGLCQIYANEPWHFELRPQAVGEGCPPTYADPTHDPRMQQ